MKIILFSEGKSEKFNYEITEIKDGFVLITDSLANHFGGSFYHGHPY